MEERKTKAGDTMLHATFEVVKGDNKGRKIFENFLLTHVNPKAVQMNFKKLKDIAVATGADKEYGDIMELAADIEEFLEIPFNADLTVKEPYTNSKGETKTENGIGKVSPR